MILMGILVEQLEGNRTRSLQIKKIGGQSASERTTQEQNEPKKSRGKKRAEGHRKVLWKKKKERQPTRGWKIR